MVSEGDRLPEFEVKAQEGEKVKSENIQNAVIYFYPKAGTPGCTNEACDFRDSISSFNDLGIDVYGASTDSVQEQKSFHEKQDLNFDLLADEEGEIAGKFGVLKESGYAERTTFVVKNGVIEKVFRKVNPSEHVDEVKEYLRDI